MQEQLPKPDVRVVRQGRVWAVQVWEHGILEFGCSGFRRRETALACAAEIERDWEVLPPEEPHVALAHSV